MMFVYKVHDVLVDLRRGFEAQHDGKGFDKLGKGAPQTRQLTRQFLRINIDSQSLGDLVGKFGDVVPSVGLSNPRGPRVCRC